jgi:hypothetical protein
MLGGDRRTVAMASILLLADGRKLDVDRVFTDQGKPAVMAILGGQKTVLERGSTPKTTIYQKRKSFFTLDGQPATEEILAAWLEDPDFPESLKREFREFLADCKSGKGPKERLEKVRRRPPSKKQSRRFNPGEAGLPTDAPERV